MSTRNMAYTVIDGLFVVVYGSSGPSDDEWVPYLLEVARQGVDRTRHLIFTEGGGPDPTQRRDLEELIDDRPVPVAVISESAAVRGMVTALSWFNGKLRAFPPAELVDALAFLQIPTSRAELIEREADKLRRCLGHSAG